MQRNYSSTQAGTTDLFEALFTQRAIRSFKSEHVPDEVLWDVLEAATSGGGHVGFSTVYVVALTSGATAWRLRGLTFVFPVEAARRGP